MLNKTSFFGNYSRVSVTRLAVPSSQCSAQCGISWRGRTRALLGWMEKITAGVLIALEFQERALLRFQEEVAESAEAVGAFVETRMLPFDGLFNP